MRGTGGIGGCVGKEMLQRASPRASPRAATVTAVDSCTLAVLAEKDFRRCPTEPDAEPWRGSAVLSLVQVARALGQFSRK